MAGAYLPKGRKKYVGWYYDELGVKTTLVGTYDRATTAQIARHKEAECRMVREGLIDRDQLKQREASRKPLGEHIRDYKDELLAKGGTEKHARAITSAIRRLLADASVDAVNDLAPDRIQKALGRLKVKRSARTANHAMGGVKAFAGWLETNGRIDRVPRGFGDFRPYNQKADRKRVRRALTLEEVAKLLHAAETGPTLDREAPKIPRVKGKRGGWGQKGRGRLVPITGLNRATLYRIALGTGFRANEIRSLTPESFHLDGDEPTITVTAAYAKNGREAVQPISRELAAWLRPIIAAVEPGAKVVPVPTRTADLIRMDLAAAGIPYETKAGVCDFHATRKSFIVLLSERPGVTAKTVQGLARHSTITLTFDTYGKDSATDARKAIEGEGKVD